MSSSFSALPMSAGLLGVFWSTGFAVVPVPFVLSQHTASRWPALPQTLHSFSRNRQSFFLWPFFPQQLHGSGDGCPVLFPTPFPLPPPFALPPVAREPRLEEVPPRTCCWSVHKSSSIFALLSPCHDVKMRALRRRRRTTQKYTTNSKTKTLLNFVEHFLPRDVGYPLTLSGTLAP